MRRTRNCISKQNQSVVKLFLNTDLENEIEGSKLVANESKTSWNVGNRLRRQDPSKTSWIASTIINYSFHICILQVKIARVQACEMQTEWWHF